MSGGKPHLFAFVGFPLARVWAEQFEPRPIRKGGVASLGFEEIRVGDQDIPAGFFVGEIPDHRIEIKGFDKRLLGRRIFTRRCFAGEIYPL
jgi:hypothetical protein